jgi:glutamate-ammonia-ligase adenylyltransferase
MFRHPERARRNLSTLDPDLAAGSRELLDTLLAQSPDPDTALHYLERYLGAAGLLPPPSRLPALLAVFAYSHFLSEVVLQQPGLLDWVLDSGALHRVITAEEVRAQFGNLPGPATDRAAMAVELASLKRRHVLRIMLRDVLRLATLAEVALELSHLADALLGLALDYVCRELIRCHGSPRLAASGAPCEFAVLALGKLGGQELNYSSDIDLLYLFTGPGETDGRPSLPNREFFNRLANDLTHLLSTATPQGFCYRVDLRLRPEGKLGEPAISLAAAENYYRTRARDWELQMLIKARVAAGSRALGRRLLDFVEPLIYTTTTNFAALESVSETRGRIRERLRRRAPAGLDIKLARGGIRDIEFLVQCLQRLYGGRDPWVRHGGTLFGLHRLRDKGYLAARDYARLSSAYQFLRTLEHRLQLEHDRQTHSLPADEAALETLARKMGVSDDLRAVTCRHLDEVTEIYERVIHGHGPSPEPSAGTTSLFRLEMDAPVEVSSLSMQAQLRFLECRFPELAARISAASIHRGRQLFEHFLSKLVTMPELLDTLEHKPELIDFATDLFEHRTLFAEWLIRHPEEILELSEVMDFVLLDQQPALFSLEAPGRAAVLGREHPELEHLLHTRAPVNEKSAWLRRFYRRQMLRLQAESICRRSPIFPTLDQTTELADWIIGAAYRIALDEASSGAGPSPPMHVVALGRLGMREFDLGSDADLVFILPDAGRPQLPLWTRVAERTLDVLTSYTGEGALFSVDTRLRPLGREGELVQTESRYKQYFAGQAQAWEAITYMKSRCLAGDVERGTGFLNELQNVDWRRYGQSGTLAGLLSDMRRRLEREQGPAHPLKAGAGGYYDIDFVLMYLRLRGAGIFYPSLNTPERIEVIERMGLLDREQADFLRSAAVFYRALDHGLRVSTGRSLAALPTAPSQLETLSELVRRWIPPSLQSRPLQTVLDEMRRGVRETYERIFRVAS